MTQNPQHQKSKCGKCGAERGFPCITNEGREAEHVHWGRPYWSAMAGRKPFKMQGKNFELNFDHLEEFTVLIDDIGLQPDQCDVCGDPKDGPALTRRCKPQHQPPKEK